MRCLLHNTNCRLLLNLCQAQKSSRHISNNNVFKSQKDRTSEQITNKAPPQEAANVPDDNFATKYCIGLVQKYDYENYLSSLLLPQRLRRAAFALRAFNVEVSRSVTGNQTEPQIGKLRLKFWYDSIDKCFDWDTKKSYVQDQPVLRELQHVVGTQKVNKLYLRRLVTARERPLNQSFETLRDIETYADQTCASVFHLLVELAGMRDIQIDHAASHLGKAQGIAMLLRAIPHTGRQQAVCVPLEILMRHGVSQERILRSDVNDKGAEECIYEVASAANTHLKLARQLLPQVSRDVRKIFLPAVSTDAYLEKLRRAHFQVTHASCIKRDSMLPLKLFYSYLFNKY